MVRISITALLLTGLVTLVACAFCSAALASGRRPQPHFQAVSQVIQRAFFRHEIGVVLSPLPGSGPGPCTKDQRTAFLQALAELRERPPLKPEEAARVLFSRAKCMPWIIFGRAAEPGIMRIEVLHMRELPSERIIEAVEAYWRHASTQLQMSAEVSAVMAEIFPVDAPRNFVADPLGTWADLQVTQVAFSIGADKSLKNSISLYITFRTGN